MIPVSVRSTGSEAMRIIIHPLTEPEREIDVTHRLIAAIAEELWRHGGGNDHLNWIEAERHLRRIVGCEEPCLLDGASTAPAAFRRTDSALKRNRWHERKESRHAPAA